MTKHEMTVSECARLAAKARWAKTKGKDRTKATAAARDAKRAKRLEKLALDSVRVQK